MDVIAETYKDVDLLLWDVSHRFVRRYGGTLDEAKSSANESFMIAYENWDPTSTMAFSTYVRKVVWDRFRDQARSFAIKYGREPVIDTVELDPIEPSTSNTWTARDISNDAEEIVDLVTEPEFKEFRTAMNRQRKLSKLEYLKQYLANEWDWPTKRIDNACEEICGVLIQHDNN